MFWHWWWKRLFLHCLGRLALGWTGSCLFFPLLDVHFTFPSEGEEGPKPEEAHRPPVPSFLSDPAVPSLPFLPLPHRVLPKQTSPRRSLRFSHVSLTHSQDRGSWQGRGRNPHECDSTGPFAAGSGLCHLETCRKSRVGRCTYGPAAWRRSGLETRMAVACAQRAAGATFTERVAPFGHRFSGSSCCSGSLASFVYPLSHCHQASGLQMPTCSCIINLCPKRFLATRRSGH